MTIRARIEAYEERILTPQAAKVASSLGRCYPEAEHDCRSAYQRDRDRIIHAKSFRKLEYKTQVFVNHEGDYYRTRLTHSLEVAQIARTVARMMCLNEDLVEALSLAHDLGHTPFGHAGEQVLNELLIAHGGFNHNHQSFHVVTKLEHSYPQFPGLNLSWELLEGILKHKTAYKDSGAAQFLVAPSSSLEAQLVAISDEIAYNNHDLDDGLLSGIVKEVDLSGVTLWQLATKRLQNTVGHITETKVRHAQTIRVLIDILVQDLFENSTRQVAESGCADIASVRNLPHILICFSSAISGAVAELTTFLRHNLYDHYRVLRMTAKAKRVMCDLFETYDQYPEQLPPRYYKMCTDGCKYAAIRDYIAGMTDRFALLEHQKLFDPLSKV